MLCLEVLGFVVVPLWRKSWTVGDPSDPQCAHTRLSDFLSFHSFALFQVWVDDAPTQRRVWNQNRLMLLLLFCFFTYGAKMFTTLCPILVLTLVLSMSCLPNLCKRLKKKISNVCFVAISELPVFDFSWFSFSFFQWHCLFMGSVLCTVGRYSRCGAAPLCMPYMLVFSQNVRSDFVKEEIPRPSSWSSDASSLKVY